MPFNELQRRDSWPPTIVRICDDEPEIANEIDQDPFSFFLTSPEDIDELLDDDDLDAGIETLDSSRSHPVRTVSPSALQRVPLKNDEDDEDAEDDNIFGLAMPLSLKDFTFRHTTGRKSRADHRAEDTPKGLGIAIPEFSGRGRPNVRLTPSRGRGRGQTRSLSARRPQSWREPSKDLYSITEERESDDNGDRKKMMKSGEGAMGLSSSAPASTVIEQRAVVAPRQKKRVHWA